MLARKLILDIMVPLMKGKTGLKGEVSQQISSYIINFGGMTRVIDDVKTFAVDFNSRIEEHTVDGYAHSLRSMTIEIIKWGNGREHLLSEKFIPYLNGIMNLPKI